VDTQNSQKRSPRSSAKSKPDRMETPDKPRRSYDDSEDDALYIDRSFDHVARVRAAKEAAQREMEKFGDVSEYDVTIIQGQLKEEPATASQPALDFEQATLTEDEEG
jgi:hypothetical protein